MLGPRTDLGTLLGERAAALGDREFLTVISRDPTPSYRTLSFREFNAEVNRVARGLAARGVESGNFVALMLPNSVEYLLVSWALKKLGAVEVGINCEFRGDALGRIIAMTEPRLLITANVFSEVLGPVLPNIEALETVVITDEKPLPATAWAGKEVVQFAEILSEESSNPERVVHDDADLCLIVFTSGSTGLSKGCMLSHRWAVRMAECIVEFLELTEHDCLYTFYPMYHAQIWAEVLPALQTGARAVVSPAFSLSSFWREAREHRVTWLCMQGSVSKLLWDLEPGAKDRDHEIRITWAAPLAREPEEFEARFGFKTVTNVYGSTEIGMLFPVAPGTSGSNVRPTHEAKIIDAHDDEVLPGVVGEIVVRPSDPDVMFKGYFGAPEKTVESWRNLWFHTGDLGVMDEQGRFRFVERAGDRIRSRGHMVSATEIEEAVVGHAAVSECVAVGFSSEMGDEDICIFVTLRPGRQLTKAELHDHCVGKIARYMVPRRIAFLDDLPRTPTGKPARGELKKLL